MTFILQDLSQPELNQAIAENLCAFLPFFGFSEQGEVHDTPELLWSMTNVPFPIFNSIIRCKLAPENVAPTIDDIITRGKSRNVPLLWWTCPSTSPANIGESLKAHGFVFEEDVPGMALDLQTLDKEISSPEGFTMEMLQNADQLKEWRKPFAESFKMPEFAIDALLALFERISFVEKQPYYHVIGRLNGQAVAVGSVFLGAGVAGIYNIGTIPVARRKGIGSIITHALLQKAISEGYRISVLHSSPMGKSVYSKLGYREYCALGQYLWMPTATKHEKRFPNHNKPYHEQFVPTAHGRIWVGSYGQDESRVPLLVLHGGPGFLSMPREICDLADERPVIFYDQLGCGRSDRPADTSCFTLEHYVEELAEVRAALGLDRLHIMGQSWGAMLAAEYVLRLQLEGIVSLVLCGPLLSAPMWERDQRRYVNQLPAVSVRIIEDAEREGQYKGEDYRRVMMDYYRRHACRLDPWPDDILEALGQLNTDIYTTMWGPTEFTVTGTLKYADLLPRLSEIKQPTLMTCGEHDEAAPSTMQTYRDALPHGEMAVIPNASHAHHLEQPEIFRAIVREFLARTESHTTEGNT